MIKTRIVAALLALFVVPVFVAQLAIQPARAEAIGDPVAGEKIFKKCAKCHQIGEGAKHRIGPILNDVFGRQAGSADGFKRYSKGMIRMGKDGLHWDYEHLMTYLENPKSLVSGTRMSFRGLKKEKDRHDVIAYLRTFSASPADIPEAAPTALPHEVQLPPETLALVGDPEFGEYLSGECSTCHQKNGADYGIPSITGWEVDDFVVAMHAYKTKARPHPVMQMMAGRLTDEEIAALAAYYAGLGHEQ